MKTCVAAVFLAACAYTGGAQAEIFTRGLYTVIGYSGARPDFKSIPNVATPSLLDGVEADIGWRFSRFYSVEASYSYFWGSKSSNGISFDSKLQTGSIDALGYLPLGRESPWALYGDIGATAYFASIQSVLLSSSHYTRFGARAGGGLQYQFDDSLGLRLSGRYEWANLPIMKSAEVVTLGLVWQR